MELLKRKYFLRIIITLIIAVMGWLVRWMMVPEMLLWQHLLATVAFIVVIQVVWEIFERMHNLLNRWMPFSNYLYSRLVLQLTIGILILLGVRYITTYLVEAWLPFKLDNIVLTMMLVANIGIAIAINMIFISGHFIQQWKEELTRVANVQMEKAQMQYHHLKNQVNPHFLFNALTSLDTLVKTDSELASQYINHLSKVYRYVLEHKENEVVSLDAELDFIHHYISLQRIRFRKGLMIGMRISPEAKEKGIVMVTVQMLIDNAIKHNEVNEQRPLTIQIYDRDDFLVATNNKQRKVTMEPSTRQGLKQLTELYAYLTEKPIRILDSETSFTIEIPFL